MAALARQKQETFAQSLARGMNAGEAGRAAGYKAIHDCGALSKRAAIVKRVEEISRHIAWGGSRELSGLIDELMHIAMAARKLGSAAALVAAKSAVVEAAKLKRLLPADEDGAPSAPIVDEILSDEEWNRRYGPAAP
ncbi:MAG: hypothetical protein ABI306_03385 [Caulobacteraceae bacterium]